MGLALEEPRETDQVETINGIQVAIEQRIYTETQKLTLDLNGSGLILLGADSCC